MYRCRVLSFQSTASEGILIKRIVSALPLLLMLLFAACLTNPVDLGDHEPYVQQFQLMWDTFDENYIGFIFSDVDWDAVYDEYMPQVEEVESQQELIDIFTEILAMFEDGHLWIYLPSGEQTFPWMPDFTENFDMPLLWFLIDQLSEDGFHSWDSDSTWGHAMIDSIPYIMIRQMASDLEMGPLATFISNHQDARTMIIDVRMNGGGVSPTVESIARYFCSEKTLIYQTVVRNGPGWEDFSPPEPVYIYPLTVKYEGPVILLIGEYSASATEWFAAAVDQLPQFVLAGDTTMKEISSPTFLDLASGYQYTCTMLTLLHADGTTWLQETGVAPHYYVEATEEDFSQGVDPVLDFAIQWANEQ